MSCARVNLHDIGSQRFTSDKRKYNKFIIIYKGYEAFMLAFHKPKLQITMNLLTSPDFSRFITIGPRAHYTSK